MSTSIEIALTILMASAVIVLMLEAIGNRASRSVQYDKPHIKLFTMSAIFVVAFLISLDLSSQNLLSRRPQLFFDKIACLFLVINTAISMHIGQKTLARLPSNDIFFLLLSALVVGMSNIWTDYLVLKMLTSTSWLIIMATLAAKTTTGGKKAEISLKLSFSALLVFLLFLFSLFFLSFSFTASSLANITQAFPTMDIPSIIGLTFFVLAGLNMAGVPPFSFAHVDCADGSNLSTSFLLLCNSMILGASHLMDAKDILSKAGPSYAPGMDIIGFVLAIGLLIAWLRALDQSKIRRCATYIAATISPLFCLSLLFGASALLPKLIFLLAMFGFATLAIFALFGSLAYMEPMDLPWQTWEDLAGFGRKNQVQTLYFLIALASIAGLPGTLGYFVKLSLIAPMKDSPWFSLSVFISIAIGASCTMRFFVFLFSKQSPGNSYQTNVSPPFSLLAASLVLIILGFFPFVR